MINITFSCDGCEESVTIRNALKREFVSFSGKPYGLGHYIVPGVESVTPEGWVAFDPYTGATYCSKCWAEIEKEPDAKEATQ